MPYRRVRRTLAISCEAVPAVSDQRGHEAAPSATASNDWRPGAAESLVSFIALFGGHLLASRTLSCPSACSFSRTNDSDLLTLDHASDDVRHAWHHEQQREGAPPRAMGTNRDAQLRREERAHDEVPTEISRGHSRGTYDITRLVGRAATCQPATDRRHSEAVPDPDLPPTGRQEQHQRGGYGEARSNSEARRQAGGHVVHRTLAISCEAVPAVPGQRGHEAAPLVGYSPNQPGAAESLVCFIALFGRTALLA